MRLAFRKEDLLIFWLLSVLLILELFVVLSVSVFGKLTFLVTFFLATIKILSAVFLVLNIFFLIATLLLKEKKLVSMSWRVYLEESLRFSFSASVVALFGLSVSALLGVLLFSAVSRLYHFSAFDSFVDSLRSWIARNTY